MATPSGVGRRGRGEVSSPTCPPARQVGAYNNEIPRRPKIAGLLGMTFTVVILFAISGYNIYYYLKDHAGAARIDYLSELNKFVADNSKPGDKIYGSFELVPLVAGATGRQIVENFIDTNNKTFTTGIYKLPEREKILAEEKVKFVITKVLVDADGNLLELGDYISLNFLQTNCRVIKQFPIYKDYYSNLTLVWNCF